jgi:hypothetical protein
MDRLSRTSGPHPTSESGSLEKLLKMLGQAGEGVKNSGQIALDFAWKSSRIFHRNVKPEDFALMSHKNQLVHGEEKWLGA